MKKTKFLLLALALAGAVHAAAAPAASPDGKLSRYTGTPTIGEPVPVVEAKPVRGEGVLRDTGIVYSGVVAPSGPITASTILFQPALNLMMRAGTGQITINLKTGQVDLPKDMTLPDAAVAFWLRVAQAFPECRQAMLTGDPTPLTTMWGDDYMKANPEKFKGHNLTVGHYYFVYIGSDTDKRYEMGLRSDGVCVWREVKQEGVASK